MALGVDSAGAGHGKFGKGPCGHGPWLTYPFTPGYPFTMTQGYAVDAVAFEDTSEQRFARATERGGQFTYTMPHIDSATALAVSSWVQAAIGPATRFKAWEYRTNRPMVVRLAEADWSTARGPGINRDTTLTFRVCRDVTYAEQVMADSPVAYWRLGEATGQSTVIDATGNGKHGVIVAGVTLQQCGPLSGDWNRSIAVTSGGGTAAQIRVGAMPIADAFTFECWFRHPRPSATAQHLLIAQQQSGTAWFIKMLNGILTTHQGTAAVQFSATTAAYADDTWHHLVWARSAAGPGFADVYADGQNVTGTVTTSVPTTAVASLCLGSLNGAQGFEGYLDDVALYDTALSAERVRLHYLAGGRP